MKTFARVELSGYLSAGRKRKKDGTLVKTANNKYEMIDDPIEVVYRKKDNAPFYTFRVWVDGLSYECYSTNKAIAEYGWKKDDPVFVKADFAVITKKDEVSGEYKTRVSIAVREMRPVVDEVNLAPIASGSLG